MRDMTALDERTPPVGQHPYFRNTSELQLYCQALKSYFQSQVNVRSAVQRNNEVSGAKDEDNKGISRNYEYCLFMLPFVYKVFLLKTFTSRSNVSMIINIKKSSKVKHFSVSVLEVKKMLYCAIFKYFIIIFV